MILALDHKIFGSGYGLGTPFWDGRFYWLVDTAAGKRTGRRGQLYTCMAGHGAQLHSIQWTHPKPQERRRLNGVEFKPFSSHRTWGRVMVAWSATQLPKDIGEANTWLRQFEADLGRIL